MGRKSPSVTCPRNWRSIWRVMKKLRLSSEALVARMLARYFSRFLRPRFPRVGKVPAGSSPTITYVGFSGEETEWCDRRLLARIHRLTLGTLRSQIQPATAAQFMRWHLRWQHVAPSTQVLGERGTLETLQQLQGFEAPANSWERQILSRRIANYDPDRKSTRLNSSHLGIS